MMSHPLPAKPVPHSPFYQPNSPYSPRHSTATPTPVDPHWRPPRLTQLTVDTHSLVLQEGYSINWRTFRLAESTSTAKRTLAVAFSDPSSSGSTPQPPLPPPDHLRLARLHIDRIAATLGEDLHLFALAPLQLPDVLGKGKGRELEREPTLWAFAITRGPTPGDAMQLDERPGAPSARLALEALDLEGLTALADGVMSHETLVPALYPAGQPSASLDTPCSSTFPSALDLSRGLTSAETSAPYQAFLLALQDALVASLVRRGTADHGGFIRLGASLILLPPPLSSSTTGPTSIRPLPQAVECTLHLSPDRFGFTVQPSVRDAYLRPFPLSPSAPSLDASLLLAPSRLTARFVELFKIGSGSRDRELEQRMRESWHSALGGTGLVLNENERWVVCRLDRAGPESEAVWPASLCLLDVSKPTTLRSPPHREPPDLQPADETSSSTKVIPLPPLSPTHVAPLLSLDPNVRRRLAGVLKRTERAGEPFREPIGYHAERVGVMLVELVKQREEAARREAESALQSASKISTSVAATPTNAPINMRTPISLGGSMTDGPSPADTFMHDAQRLSTLPTPMTSALEIDHVYPSPPRLPLRTEAPPPVPTVTTYAGFEWEEETFGGGMQGGRGGDFDDGMMMGLTDDDFSFFDNPVAPAVSLPVPSSLGRASSIGTSPLFTDHFPQLAGTPGTTEAMYGSPIVGYGDLSGNALGLGLGATPLEMPRTPYSPFVDAALVESPALLNFSLFDLATSPSRRSTPSTSKFDSIPFRATRRSSEDKYDPTRRGKFGLPTSCASLERRTSRTPSMRDMTASLQKLEPKHLVNVFDPRIGKATSLRRSSKLVLETQGEEGGRNWVRSNVAAESESEGESEDDLEEMEGVPPTSLALRRASRQDDSVILAEPFGPALLFESSQAELIVMPSVVEGMGPIKEEEVVTISTRELIATMLADQLVHNPFFRTWAAEGMHPVDSSPMTVSSYAIQLAHNRLASILDSPRSSTLLVAQAAPMMLLRHQQAIMQLSSSSIRFWKTMGFEPLAGVKDVLAFVIYEEGGMDLTSAVKAWMGQVSESYQTLRLGTHALGTAGPFVDGMILVPSGALSGSGNSFLKPIVANLEIASRNTKRIVVYLLNPAKRLVHSPSSPVTVALHNLCKIDAGGTASVVVYALSLSTALMRGPGSAAALARLSFAVYDRLPVLVNKLISYHAEPFPKLSTSISLGKTSKKFQSPAFTISPARKSLIEFNLQWPASSYEIQDRHRLLQVAYSISPVEGGLEWVVVSCVDEKGESWRVVSKLFPVGAESKFRFVWSTLRAFAEEASVEWRIVISRVGIMSSQELTTWEEILTENTATWERPAHITLLCIELSPPLSVLSRSGNPSARSSTESDPSTVTTTEFRPVSLNALKSYLDTQAALYSYTPTEPICLGPQSDLAVPVSAYLIALPRIATLSHSPPTLLLTSGPRTVTLYALHFLSSHHTPSSTLAIKPDQNLQEIRQNFCELAGLAKERQGTEGTLPLHVDACLALGRVLLDI